MAHNTCIVRLPYPIRVGLFSFNRTKKIGLSFDNLSMFLMRQAMGFEKPSDLTEWVKKHGNEKLFVETIWGATMSFHSHSKGLESFKLEKDKFMIGLQQLEENQTKKILDAYNNSQTYGLKEIGSKKKAKKN